jgi:cell pole-organizing protein PopZ
MEDILASIRRILNEEETPQPGGPAAEDKGEADEDVLLLDQSMMVPADEAHEEVFDPEPVAKRPEPPVRAAVPVVEPEPEPVVAAKPPEPALPELAEATPQPLGPQPDLMAPETAAAAASSLGSLVRTLSAGRATQVYSGGPTLEDLVRAELRPLLKEWLDSNLPPIVERLVRIEIERVVGRAVP